MSKRFFAFGCSVTEFSWPTWADVIGKTLHEQGYKYYNFGNSGGGNYNMFASMVAADAKYKFTDDDIIMVMWSSWNREDRYLTNYGWDPGVRGQWTKEGNILTACKDSHRFTPEFIERYWTMENDIVRNITSIQAARKMFNIAWEGTIPIWESDDPESENPAGPDNIVKDTTIEQQIFDNFIALDHTDWVCFEDMLAQLGNNTHLKYMMEWDGHPIPIHQLQHVKDVIQPAVPHVELSNDNTEAWVRQFMTIAKQTIADFLKTNKPNDAYTDRSWMRKLHLEHSTQQKSYVEGTKNDLWEDQTFLDLLDQFSFKSYKN